jgi:hypothetical protein
MILRMRFSRHAVIPSEKLTSYLLVERRHNDKARYLAQAGFTQDNPALLEQAIRDLIAHNEAVIDRLDVYGVFYQVEGTLVGPTGVLNVVTIWLERAVDGELRFVTLKPRR